jgi:hypothetical protein
MATKPSFAAAVNGISTQKDKDDDLKTATTLAEAITHDATISPSRSQVGTPSRTCLDLFDNTLPGDNDDGKDKEENNPKGKVIKIDSTMVSRLLSNKFSCRN